MEEGEKGGQAHTLAFSGLCASVPPEKRQGSPFQGKRAAAMSACQHEGCGNRVLCPKSAGLSILSPSTLRPPPQPPTNRY
eukprot:357281-Chlamydomonas_euryale.AAC.4